MPVKTEMEHIPTSSSVATVCAQLVLEISCSPVSFVLFTVYSKAVFTSSKMVRLFCWM